MTQAAHIGLNLIFLVPGETGGMEVAARELIPALLAAGARGHPLHGLHQPGGRRRDDGPWGELLPAVTVPVNARNRVQWVLGEQTAAAARWPRARASIWCTASPAPPPHGAASAAS